MKRTATDRIFAPHAIFPLRTGYIPINGSCDGCSKKFAEVEKLCNEMHTWLTASITKFKELKDHFAGMDQNEIDKLIEKYRDMVSAIHFFSLSFSFFSLLRTNKIFPRPAGKLSTGRQKSFVESGDLESGLLGLFGMGDT